MKYTDVSSADKKPVHDSDADPGYQCPESDNNSQDKFSSEGSELIGMPFDYNVPIKTENKNKPQVDFGEDGPKPHPQCKKCSSGTREYFSEFCNNTSLHGLKYVGGEKRSTFEKVMWLCLFLCSVSMCSYMIYQIYSKWVNTPVIVSFSQIPSPIGSVPFPAVTICPQNKAKQSVYNFTRLYLLEQVGEIRDEEKEILRKLKVVCDFLRKEKINRDNEESLLNFDDKEYYDAEYDDKDEENSSPQSLGSEEGKDVDNYIAGLFENESFIDFLMKAAPSHPDIFHSCTWNAQTVDCKDLFYPTLNEDGICYTFNMVADDDLFRGKTYRYKVFNETSSSGSNYFIETGYENVPIEQSYPYRTIGAGIRAGLELQLKLDEFDFDYICKTSIQGFKIILHDPISIPRGKTRYIRVPIDQEITIAVQPNMITTSESLMRYSPYKRYCYFQADRKLNFFKNYTQQNCELECLGHYILKECECVPFYIPRLNTTKICGHGKLSCVENVERSFLRKALQTEKSEKTPPCKCYPACFSIDYAAETTQATYNWWKFRGTMDLIQKLEKKFEDRYIRPSEDYDDDDDDNDDENDNVETNDSDNHDADGSGDGDNDNREEETNKKVDETQSERLKGEDDELHVIHYTSLKIFFKDYQFTSTERSELYGFSDFVANCGGLLGLFTGFSFLSLMEILYYLTIRSWINKHLFGKFLMETPADPDEYNREKTKREVEK